MRLRCGEVREVGVVQARAGTHQPFPLEAREPLLHVGSVLRAALLAVIDHVHPGTLLPSHHLGDSLTHTGGERFWV